MNESIPAPHDRSYWVEPGRVIGGNFPGDRVPAVARHKLRAIIDAGVRVFINLQEEDELDHGRRPFVSYAPMVQELAREKGLQISVRRFPIRDVSIPTEEVMDDIQAEIRAAHERGEVAYVHCWGGRGRTGTVVGVYLIQRRLATPGNFVDVIARLRRHDQGGGPSPEVGEQKEFVRSYIDQREGAEA